MNLESDGVNEDQTKKGRWVWVLGERQQGTTIAVTFPQEAHISLSSDMSRPALGSNQTPNQCQYETTYRGQSGRSLKLTTLMYRLLQITNLMHNSFILKQYVSYTTILNMFRAAPCSSSGGQIVLLQPLVSSPSVNSRTVCRWRAECSPFSTCILYGCLQRVTIPETVVIQFVLLRMSRVLLETCWGS